MRRLRIMKPPGKKRVPSSSRSKRIRLTIDKDDGGESETTGSAALVSPFENDDLLALSLRRLPALPSSLLRASAVRKSWGRVISDPHILREFRAHHRNPPLLGFFHCDWGIIQFISALDPPDEIPSKRLQLWVDESSILLRCHHSRLLILNRGGREQQQIMVWDPITGELCRIAMPPSFNGNTMLVIDGGVVCASTDRGHVHGACHSDPFLVVMLSIERERNSICKLLIGERAAVLEFDWAKQKLAIFEVPSEPQDYIDFMCDMCQFFIAPAVCGGLIFLLLKGFIVRVWKRTSNRDGVATWMPGNTIELNALLSLGLPVVWWPSLSILGLDEQCNVLFRLTNNSGVVFMVHLESRNFKILKKTYPFKDGHPFSSFYTPGIHANNTGGDDAVQNIPGALNF